MRKQVYVASNAHNAERLTSRIMRRTPYEKNQTAAEKLKQPWISSGTAPSLIPSLLTFAGWLPAGAGQAALETTHAVLRVQTNLNFLLNWHLH